MFPCWFAISYSFIFGSLCDRPNDLRNPEDLLCSGFYTVCLNFCDSPIHLPGANGYGHPAGKVNCSRHSEIDSTGRYSTKENHQLFQWLVIVVSIWWLEYFQLCYSRLYDTFFSWNLKGGPIFIFDGWGNEERNWNVAKEDWSTCAWSEQSSKWSNNSIIFTRL